MAEGFDAVVNRILVAVIDNSLCFFHSTTVPELGSMLSFIHWSYLAHRLVLCLIYYLRNINLVSICRSELR